MKQLGKVSDSKDITTKEYVDQKDKDLDERKLEDSDLSELSNQTVLSLWNKYMGEGGGEVVDPNPPESANVILSTDIESDKNSHSKAATPKAVYDFVRNTTVESSGTVKSIWVGSQSEYDAISIKSDTTLYFITG